MNDVKSELALRLEEALDALFVEAGADVSARPAVVLDVPRQKEHGDFACNTAMQLAKPLRKSPRAIAEALVERLGDAGGLVARSEIAGPGFVNLWLAGERWRDVLRGILEVGDRFGRADHGGGRPVQVEFVSANPTGPLSTGHARQGVLGDCIARLLDFTGFKVTREFYFNDGGRQVRVLGASVKARYLEELGRAAPPPAAALADPDAAWVESVDGLPVEFPKDGYRGEYIRELARALLAERGDGLSEEPAEGVFLELAVQRIFAEMQSTLERTRIEFDVYTNEKTFYEDGKIEQVLADLREAGCVYEADGAVWLRSTDWGLDRDRVLVRSSGEPTYLLPDLAYHREKLRRDFALVVDVLGADHIEQFPFVRAGVGVLGFDPERIELVMHQFVTITSGGERVKQSKRRANFVTWDELLEEVGTDCFRFFMVERKAEGHLDFDLDLAKDRNWRKNPAYYVQYAHARSCGIERRAAEAGAALLPEAFDADRLELPEEIALIKKLGEFPELVAHAAASRAPHHVAYYLRELAGLWNPYLQDGRQHRVVSEDAGLTAARLALVAAVRVVLANGLWLLGLSAPEQM